jgi:hypothetical protein
LGNIPERFGFPKLLKDSKMLTFVIIIGIIALVGVGRFFKTIGVLILIAIAAAAVLIFTVANL